MEQEQPPTPSPTLPARLRAAADALETDEGLPAPDLAALARAIVESLPEPLPENDAPLVIHTGVPAATVEAFGQQVDLREQVMRAFAETFGYQAEVIGGDGKPAVNPMSRARFVTDQVNRFIGRVAGERFVREVTAAREEEARGFVAQALAQVGLAAEGA